MAYVVDLLYSLRQKIDPRDKDGADIPSSAIHSTDGDRFTAQQLLDVWNEARLALVQTIAAGATPRQIASLLPDCVVRTSITFSDGIYTKPDGFVACLALIDSTGKVIPVLSGGEISLVQHLDSSGNPLVVNEDAQIRFHNSARALGTPYTLRYIGLSRWTLNQLQGTPENKWIIPTGSVTWTAASDTIGVCNEWTLENTDVGSTIMFVVDTGQGGGTCYMALVKTVDRDGSVILSGEDLPTSDGTVLAAMIGSWVQNAEKVKEVFPPHFEPLLLELAQAIASEAGAAQVNALAASLLSRARGGK